MTVTIGWGPSLVTVTSDSESPQPAPRAQAVLHGTALDPTADLGGASTAGHDPELTLSAVEFAEVRKRNQGLSHLDHGVNTGVSTAARAMADADDRDAEATARRALEIAAGICVYTNGNMVVEVIGA